MFRIFLVVIMLLLLNACTHKQAVVKAPFKKLDTYSTNEWWKKDDNKIVNLKVDRDEVIAFCMYTVSNKVLKLSAQFYPLLPDETKEAIFEIQQQNNWVKLETQTINEIGWSVLFRIENWDHSKDISYRVKHASGAVYEGLIRKDPIDKNEISLVALSCNGNKEEGSRDNFVQNINFQNPDLVFFAGDQSYDHREHTAAWIHFGLQFREVFRNRPCVIIPDDHDVGNYNLWGEGGQKAKSIHASSGGYRFDPEYVNMVQRCQTSHLPDPYDASPVEQGITVYYTNLVLGGIDFAILEDRKFKSAPKGNVKHIGKIRSDLIRNENYNTESVDVEGLKLLGDRQLAFLEEWAKPTKEVFFKVALSQTGFANIAHIHGRFNRRAAADLDSNGWPQAGREKALEVLSKAGAIHVAGDQHLATVVQHGLAEFEDGPWSFVVPAIENSIYSRWWWPQEFITDESTVVDSLPWVGNYLDGFQNKITMHAYANPDQESFGAGYGLIRFNKKSKEVIFECWPQNANVENGESEQFVGWPVHVTLP